MTQYRIREAAAATPLEINIQFTSMVISMVFEAKKILPIFLRHLLEPMHISYLVSQSYP